MNYSRAIRVTVFAALAAHGCDHYEPGGPPAQTSAAMNVASIPTAGVSGTLGGQRFVLREAWYRVQRRAGRERIDLVLSEGRATRLCAESDPEGARHVWVRFPRWQRFSAGEYRIDPNSANPAMSVHYEAPREHAWEGRGVASAVVVIDEAAGDTVSGRIRACFGDATRSCVAGSFRAQECRSELDPDGPNAGNIRRREAPDGGGGAP